VAHEILQRPRVAPRSRFEPEGDPDLELVARWQAGDADSFGLLVKRHERRVFRILYRMLGSVDEAADVAQETFLNLHRHGHRFRRESRFSPSLPVAVNAAQTAAVAGRDAPDAGAGGIRVDAPRTPRGRRHAPRRGGGSGGALALASACHPVVLRRGRAPVPEISSVVGIPEAP
jgi:hypothetical protein